MDYLKKTLKIKIRYMDWDDASKLPYMITDRYDFRIVWLDDCKVLFVYVKDELDQLAAVRKHLQQIRSIAYLPLVLILDVIDARRRQQLIDADIPFVVPKQQIYLPFLGAVLQERYIREYPAEKKLMPSAELLLLYFISRKCEPLYMNDATNALGFSAMTISRAVRQLESINLIRTYKDGVNKVIISDHHGRELFDRARSRLESPVKRSVYIDKDVKADILPLAGYSALTEYSFLNPPQVKCYAVNKMPAWASGTSKTLIDSDKQIKLELWHYDPLILSDKNKVAPLPLALSLEDDPDERVQQSLDEAIENYWEKYDGQRI